MVYCSSSQQVKQRYRFDRPRPGVYRVRTPVRVAVTVEAERVRAEAVAAAGAGLSDVTARVDEAGVFEVGRRDDAGEPAIREAFGKMGDTPFETGDLTVANPRRRFVPVSVLNRLRRSMATALAEAVERARSERDEARAVESVSGEVRTGSPEKGSGHGDARPPGGAFWSLKTDRLEHVEAFTDADWAGVDELLVDVSALPPSSPEAAWAALTERLGTGRVRMALPVLMRAGERTALTDVIGRLWQAGCRHWEASNPWAWTVLEAISGGERPDLTAGWPLYVLNRQAACCLSDLGARAFVCSPEDGLPNLRSLLAEWGERAIVTAYEDVPLFISDNCGRAGLARECRADGTCRRADLPMKSASGDEVRLIQRGCRTIVIGARPFSLGRRLGQLRAAGASRFRAAFVWRHYLAGEAVAVWRELRAGRSVAGSDGNFESGPE